MRRLDDELKESHRHIRLEVKASGSSLTELFGVGPIWRSRRDALSTR